MTYTLDQRLYDLQNALLDLQYDLNVTVRITPLWDEGEHSAIIVIEGVDVVDGRLVARREKP